MSGSIRAGNRAGKELVMGKKSRLRRQRKQRMAEEESRVGLAGNAGGACSSFMGNADGRVTCGVASVGPDGSVELEGLGNADSVDALVQASLLLNAQPSGWGLGRVGDVVLHGHEADWYDINRAYRFISLTHAYMEQMRQAGEKKGMTGEEAEECIGVTYGTLLRLFLMNTARTLSAEPPFTVRDVLGAPGDVLKRTDELMHSELARLGFEDYADVLDLPEATLDASLRDAGRTYRRAQGDDDEPSAVLRDLHRAMMPYAGKGASNH